jgi:hypothetical protein
MSASTSTAKAPATRRGVTEQAAVPAIDSGTRVLRLPKTFTDPRLCAAIVDRLTFAGQIIETGTTSYRLAHARASRAVGR